MRFPRRAEIFDALNRASPPTVALLSELAGAGSILELGCGTGRHLVALQARGHRVVGVDHCADMLATARRRLGDARLVHSDLRELDLGGEFDVVFASTDTLAMLEVPAHRVDVIRRASRHVRRGGYLVVAFANPACYIQTDSQRLDRCGPVAGGEIRVIERRVVDLVTGLRHGDKLERFIDAAGAVFERTSRRALAIVGRPEIAASIAAAGLVTVSEYGDFDRTPVTAASPRVVVVASHAARAGAV